MLSSSKLMWKNRNRLLFRFNYCLILFILLLIFCLLSNQRLKKIKFNLHQVDEPTDVHLFIDHIRDTAIIDQKIHFNILYNITSEDIPKWLNQYGITQFFNFYWLQNGGYLWHIQRSINLKQDYNNPKRSFQQTIPDNFHSINLFNYLQFHPEYGILLDTSSDPIQPLFPLLPQSSSSFEQLCQQYQWLMHWYPCITDLK
ncbi:hypothetical protein I4U23_029908 [Adineta vaga]|nr:hypothetical protein I4U23_029908 [Adineta vaga]